MSKYEAFIFKSYNFNPRDKVLRLIYGYDDSLEFTEEYFFDFGFAEYDEAVLDRAIQTLFFLAGISYYKAYLPNKILVKKGQIDETTAQFLSTSYKNGLGEFFYVNGLNPRTKISFPINSKALHPITSSAQGSLIGIGGGKDSILAVEILRDVVNFDTWSLGHRQQLAPLIETLEPSKHFWVERKLDAQLFELNESDALNGHIPISAILAATGMVTAILSGNRDVIVGNESSSNDPTLEYEGMFINHQWSKSLEFEIIFKSYLNHIFNQSLRYYSILRPYSELRIAELFAENGFEKYKHVFTSCNRAFRQGQTTISWCGECPKCAFVFLIFSPFVERDELEKLFGKNLLLEPSMKPTYQQLLGVQADKPLDCVGEIRESRMAMNLTKKYYSNGELEKYIYSLDDNYDYRQHSRHNIPEDVMDKLKRRLSSLRSRVGCVLE